MKLPLTLLVMSCAVAFVAACSKEPASASKTPAPAAAAPVEEKKNESFSHGYEPGGLPGIAEALKGDPKKEEPRKEEPKK